MPSRTTEGSSCQGPFTKSFRKWTKSFRQRGSDPPNSRSGPLIDSLKNEFCPEPPPQEPEQKVPPPLPEKDWSHNWTCGWLTPEGDFYGCEYSGHQALCEKLGLDSYQIERRGWIKYQRREWIGYFGKDPITQKQIDALWDWSRATKKKYPYWIAGGTDADEAR
jgi:hypothetical protein